MPTRTRFRFVASVCLALFATLVGCKSDNITVEGGTNLLVTRRVSVGDTFVVRQPFDAATGADWKLGHYDTALIQPVTRYPYETHTDGSMSRVFEFKATAPGEVELTFLRRNRNPVTPGVAPPPPDTRTVKVQLVK